jgi:glutamate-ammonia-ligase adenylyltransferase
MREATYFRDAIAAARNLALVRERMPEGLFKPLMQLLPHSPDPDGALNLFERLAARASPELFPLLERNPLLLHYAIAVFGHSEFLGETLIQHPDIFQTLLREKNLERLHSREELAEAFARFRSRSLVTDVSVLLAQFKRREYVRIMLRDVLHRGTLAETTAELSALADVLMEEALREVEMKLRNRYGPAQSVDREGRLVGVPFAVLSLGKLGGNELNYSSDIDLLFLYGDGEAPAQAAIPNHEYFVRLAQELTGALSAVTSEGAPFRIDLRLRPQGGEGEMAVGFSHALDYYAHRARDWELQALIKLRHSAGDQKLAREFIRRTQPFVYTPQVNFAAIETALAARRRMGQGHRSRKPAGPAGEINVKIDRGGIRDIEFLVQCLQRVYGGAETWLRSGGTLFSLQKLHDKGHIGGADFQVLTTTYEFLRTIEHRLQLRHGRQTHRLPADGNELGVLSRMLAGSSDRGHSVSPGDPPELLVRLRQRMSAVAEVYNRVVHQQQAQQQLGDDGTAEFRRRAGETRENRQLLARLAADAPAWLERLQQPEVEAHVRRKLLRFLTSALTTPEGYAAIERSPQAAHYALQVFGVSDFLADMLVRSPEQIDVLSQIAAGARHPVPAFEDRATPADSYVANMAWLRRRYHSRLLASGVRDVILARPVWDSFADTTEAADETIGAALRMIESPPGFGVLALGRLGTREHDLLSDADLVFLREESTDAHAARRAAVRLVEVLSAYTKEGAVFPVDARLRPHGAEGELVQTPQQLSAYFAREAHAWEALTYVKSRLVAGPKSLAEGADAAVDTLLRRFAATPDFSGQAAEMRLRLEKSTRDAGNLKTGPGGIYDIDFLVGIRQVQHGRGDGEGDMRTRIHDLGRRGLLASDDCRALETHAELLRTVEHVIWLVTGRRRKILPIPGPARNACEGICKRVLERELPGGLEAELKATFAAVRELYHRLGNS